MATFSTLAFVLSASLKLVFSDASTGSAEGVGAGNAANDPGVAAAAAAVPGAVVRGVPGNAGNAVPGNAGQCSAKAMQAMVVQAMLMDQQLLWQQLESPHSPLQDCSPSSQQSWPGELLHQCQLSG